jgi:hypothetical protein
MTDDQRRSNRFCSNASAAVTVLAVLCQVAGKTAKAVHIYATLK